MLILLALVNAVNLAYSCISTPLSSSSCGCTGCSCSRPVPPSVPPQIRPAIVQPLQTNPQYPFSSPVPKDPFSPPASEPMLPESPPYSWFTTQGNAEDTSSYAIETSRKPIQQTYEAPRGQQPQPAQIFKSPAAPAPTYAGADNFGRSSVPPRQPGPPSIPPSHEARIEVMVPMTTVASYVDAGRQGATAVHRPAIPPTFLPQKKAPLASYVAQDPVAQHGPAPPGNAPTFLPVAAEKTEVTYVAAEEQRIQNIPTATPAISKSGYSSPRSGQIQVTGSVIAKETNEYVPPAKQGADAEMAKPMFLTYYNQECSGVMVAVLENTTILGATEECLKMGCQAVNAEVHPSGSYTLRIANGMAKMTLKRLEKNLSTSSQE
ncbi:hypothetical protein ANCCEY_03208 [Ancylostoma ceylanicum]|uniref:Uncharacterized protein n=1 Tax=Ancylostoma ceylanicum TaxID=53326 RepID=A0A0D6M0T6_9BILA|nr:hypothetical protein ANCCEY_03208 [Ancylostoma ceylanicum]